MEQDLYGIISFGAAILCAVISVILGTYTQKYTDNEMNPFWKCCFLTFFTLCAVGSMFAFTIIAAKLIFAIN